MFQQLSGDILYLSIVFQVMRKLISFILLLSLSSIAIGQNCGEHPTYNLDYFQENFKCGTLKGKLTNDKNEALKCVEIYIHDKTTNVAHIFTDSTGSFKVFKLLPGTYDVEFIYNDQYFRYYDVTVGMYQMITLDTKLSSFMDKKTDLKALKNRSKNRWN